MSTTAAALLVVAALVVIGLTVWCGARVGRLDRLHRRVDAARAGLGEALRRRVEVALAVADAFGPVGDPVRSAARTAGAAHAPAPDGRDPAGARQQREAAENVLTRELAAAGTAGLTPSLVEELADAQQLVILARRVHNDAVRDTLELRSRRLVRWLHLAGTAPVPVYFEIVDPEAVPAGSTAVRVQRAPATSDVDSGGRSS